MKKDRGERQTKGLQSRPLESGFNTGVRRGDVRASYEFAVMQLTRFRPVRGVLRTASTDSIVLLQLRRIRNIYRITGLICGRKLGGCISLAVSEQCSTQRQGDKRSAAADVIASHAPLRDGSHKARQNPPKHYPGDSRGRSPLARLSPLSFVVQRKMGPPEVVPKRECR